MNANDMLDYAMGQLEGPALEQAEIEIADNPETALKAHRLTEAIHQLLDDDRTFELPAGVRQRTMRLVVEGRRPKRNVLDFVPVAVPFRWADVAVAAGIFIAGLLTLLPAVSRSRDRTAQAGCVYNLQQLGRALWQYGSLHNHYPTRPEEHPSAPTGTFAVMLHDSGVLPDLESLYCPCSPTSRVHPPLPNLATVCRLHETDPERCSTLVPTDYAYNVGYRQPTGTIVPVEALYTPTTPLLADQPAHDGFPHIFPGNSPNHAGRGQNVLYTDLHVGWHNTRRIGPHDADLFLNDLRQPAPGVHQRDAALLPSRFPFIGQRGD